MLIGLSLPKNPQLFQELAMQNGKKWISNYAVNFKEITADTLIVILSW